MNLKCDQISATSDDRARIAAERLEVAQREISRMQSMMDSAATLEARLREDLARMRSTKDKLSATKDANEIELLRARLELKEAERNVDVHPVAVSLRTELREMQDNHGKGKCAP